MTEPQLKNILQTTTTPDLPAGFAVAVMQKIRQREASRLLLVRRLNLLFFFSLLLIIFRLYSEIQENSLGYFLNYWWQNFEWNTPGLADHLSIIWEALPRLSLTLILINAAAILLATKLILHLKNIANHLQKI